MQTPYLASDHGAFDAKSMLITYLNSKYSNEYTIKDLGTESNDSVH